MGKKLKKKLRKMKRLQFLSNRRNLIHLNNTINNYKNSAKIINQEKQKKKQLINGQICRRFTGADPIADARQPFGIGGGFIVDQEPGLLASVAEASECVVPIAATAALPIAFFPSTSSAAAHPYKE